jgi:hypothetical protein
VPDREIDLGQPLVFGAAQLSKSNQMPPIRAVIDGREARAVKECVAIVRKLSLNEQSARVVSDSNRCPDGGVVVNGGWSERRLPQFRSRVKVFRAALDVCQALGDCSEEVVGVGASSW